jgi:hypothetical protein
VQKSAILILIISSLSIASSAPMAYFAYFEAGRSAFNFYEVLSSFMFWVPVVSLVLRFLLRSTIELFLQYIRTLRGKLIFVSYVTVHLILYGLLLEMILHYAYKLPATVTQPSVYFGSTLYPGSVSAIITSFGFYPNISILIPPSFYSVWSFYSISLALIIGVLVVTNVMRVLDLGKISAPAQKARTFVLLPLTGVIVGATCCLSFPVLILLASAFATILPNSLAAFLIAYFVLPCATAVVLKYNVEATNKMANDVERLEKSLNSIARGLR